MGERNDGIVEVGGSIPPVSTTIKPGYFRCLTCGGTFWVDYPEMPGRKWHGFIDGTGHMTEYGVVL